jgi:tryptophanyl-tRNA synthetase (EC 6.1.1.2)
MRCTARSAGGHPPQDQARRDRPGRQHRFAPAEKAGVSNLLSILAASGGESIAALEARFAGQGYGALKAETADAVVACLEPVQQRYRELRDDEGYLREVLRAGAARAAQRADATLRRVHDVLGFIPE